MTPGSADSLSMLAQSYWGMRMENEPLFATALGDRRYGDRLADISPEGRSRIEKQYRQVIQQCDAIEESGLSVADMLTRKVLLVDAKAQVEYLSCLLDDWTVDPLGGPQVEFLNLESIQPVQSPSEARALVKRWGAIGGFFDEHISNLNRGATEGKVAVRAGVEKVIDEIEGLVVKVDSEWAFMRPTQVQHKDWSEGDLREFQSGVATAVRETIRPAYVRYLGFLKGEILPRSRPQERPGIIHVPGGSEAYSHLIRVHTSLSLTPEELHDTGLKEVARINDEMAVLGRKVFGISERKEILKRLRTDPSLYFGSREEVAEKAESALSKAKARMQKWFGRLPLADCEVVQMGEHEEKHSTIAYYRQPAADGSRPGRYYINTYAPETRPRYEAEVLAYHESIPGHHLQIAIAQELEGIPDFRKNSGVTAFVEGWGLYSERLSEEMGLYSSDLDRIGVLSYDSWRACRLVVDTGMHAMRWTRAQAINFMLENTALAENNIMNEVDRYITWPGQALAYKTGQLEIMRLRQDSERRLGDKFDIREFHDRLLGNGALPLQALREIIKDYTGSG